MTTPHAAGERLFDPAHAASVLMGLSTPASPSRALKPPSGEVKHGGYGRSFGATVPRMALFTRRRYDWSDRYPAIATVAANLSARSLTLDGRRR